MLRKTLLNDVSAVMNIINDNKSYLKASNIDQWQDGYPNTEVITNDINRGESYVYVVDNEIVGTLMLSFTGDSNYLNIDGKWSNDHAYATIHRIAVAPKHKGKAYAKKMLSAVEKIVVENNLHTIRIDTHEVNKVMISFISKCNFNYCGIIKLADGDKRNAYDKII